MQNNKLAIAALLAVAPLAANATVIDFESASTAGSCQVNDGGSIDGFTLGAYDGDSGGGFNNSSACNYIAPTANSGTQYMVNYNSVIAEFTRDIGTFSLNSLFVHSDIRVGDSTVRFQGLDGVGGAILYSMDVAITAAWEKISFAGWTNVKTFTWDSLEPGTSNIAIDDFEYDAVAVPEPGTLLLLGTGLLGFGLMRRRLKS